MNMKLLVLDGIGGISLGADIAREFEDLDIDTTHLNARILKKKPLLKLRGGFLKSIYRQILNEDFYYYPKVSNQNLKSIFAINRPSVVLVIGFLYRFFDLELIKKIKKKYGFKLFLYDTDTCNLFNHRRELIYFFNKELPVYDHIFSFSKTTTDLMSNASDSLSVSYFSFGYNFLNTYNNDYKQDVLFIGSADIRRIYLLEHLTEYNLKVLGLRWKKNYSIISSRLNHMISDRPIWGDELMQEFSRSKIILNITRSTFYGVETGVNLRIFETLSAKKFLLTDYTQELSELFVIGREIETYSCAEELKDKVKYYLSHEVQREKIAQKGYEKFISTYTWEKRVKELLKQFDYY